MGNEIPVQSTQVNTKAIYLWGEIKNKTNLGTF